MLVRRATDDDRRWIADVLRARWGGTQMALRGTLVDALQLDALVAEADGRNVGLVTYRAQPPAVEIVTLDALEQHCGIGTLLMDAVCAAAAEGGAREVILITTNDNLDALRFYQRRGFAIRAVQPGAIARSRELKPSIPATGAYGIPIRDEIELVRGV